MQATHLRVLENTWYLHGEGPVKERFLKEGLKPNSSTYLMANNYNFAEEKFTETEVIAEKVIEATSKTMPSKKVTKKYAPTKVVMAQAAARMTTRLCSKTNGFLFKTKTIMAYCTTLHIS